MVEILALPVIFLVVESEPPFDSVMLIELFFASESEAPTLSPELLFCPYPRSELDRLWDVPCVWVDVNPSESPWDVLVEAFSLTVAVLPRETELFCEKLVFSDALTLWDEEVFCELPKE